MCIKLQIYRLNIYKHAYIHPIHVYTNCIAYAYVHTQMDRQTDIHTKYTYIHTHSHSTFIQRISPLRSHRPYVYFILSLTLLGPHRAQSHRLSNADVDRLRVCFPSMEHKDEHTFILMDLHTLLGRIELFCVISSLIIFLKVKSYHCATKKIL